MKVTDPEGVRRIELFKDVYGRIILSTENVMMVLVEIPAGKLVPAHRHPHEQMGICLKGRAEFTSGGKRSEVSEGISYYIPGNVEHSVRTLGDGDSLFLDVFSPPREDYLRKLSEKGS